MTTESIQETILTPFDDVKRGVDAPSSNVTKGEFPIVGVGSSAGGLNALTSFLTRLPIDTGMAFVLIQHLDPTHESQMRSLLMRSTRMPITSAVNGAAVAPNHIYLITPNTSLSIEHGLLRVYPRDASPRPHLSIDLFFRSLALDRPGRAIGVVLSGTGSDGTLGLAAIKTAGGITFAQDDSAEHEGMPLNAIGHGCVDFILPPGEIAQEIEKIAKHGFPEVQDVLPLLADSDSQERDDDLAVLPEDGQYLAEILDLIRARAGIDFSQYRLTTIKRRIVRRLGVLDLTTLKDYVGFVSDHAEETAALVKDLLINVTSFYRDRETFTALATTLFPRLMQDRSADGPIRIWVAGCSTGQEVYSIAIELLEFLKGSPSYPATQIPAIQIFGSDISEWALAKARNGLYSESAVADLPPDRLASYFTKVHTGYRIQKSVRDLCVFAKHDVTADTPFSKIDLISCRNLLIYLAPPLQMKLFHTLHFALKPGGLLLLGSAESIGRSADLFGVVDQQHRMFHKKVTTRRITPTMVSHAQPEQIPIMTTPNQTYVPSVNDMQRAADRLSLGRFVPAGVLVNDSIDIIQYRGQTNAFLEPAQGEVSLNLLTMVPFSVADAIKAAILEASAQKIPIRRERVPLRRGESFREIAFEVIPILMASASAGCFLILFEEAKAVSRGGGADSQPDAHSSPGMASSAEAREIQQLRNELMAAHDHIQSISEQCRSLTEQIRTAQEESSSTSEEYRSTNEELQTAKEEVDATNEELITVNEELRNSNQTLAKSTELTAAIVETMRYPLLVLDSDLNVESANLAFLTAFRVTPERTIGKRIYQLGNGQWDIPELRRLLEDILPHNSAFDDFKVTHDFSDIGTRTILVNARRLHGVHPQPRIVLVFADITESNRISQDLQTKSEDLSRSNAELDQFAAVASHDMQEPLRMITNYIHLLDRRYKATFDDQAREYMGFVTSGAERMTSMIRAILAYSKLGHQGSDFVVTEAEKALADAKANLKRKIAEAKAIITHEPLPKVKSNSEQLTQLFQNLISNGMKFRSDKRPVKVHVGVIESENEWTFSIADNGIGMEAENFDKIFQLFQRLNGAQQYPGTGIGLATCKKIVGHHGGRIWVESVMDVGSTFFFTIKK